MCVSLTVSATANVSVLKDVAGYATASIVLVTEPLESEGDVGAQA